MTRPYLILLRQRNINNSWRFITNRTSDRSGSPISLKTIELERAYGSAVISSNVGAKDIELNGSIIADSDTNLQAELAAFDSIKGLDQTELAFFPEWKRLANSESIGSPAITLAGNAANLRFDVSDGETDKGCTVIDLDTSLLDVNNECRVIFPIDAGDLATDFTSINNTGSFGIWLYLPVTTKPIDAVRVIITATGGSLEGATNGNYVGDGLSSGWNFLAIAMDRFVVTSTPVLTAVSSITLGVFFDSAEPDRSNIKISSPIWFETRRARVYSVYPNGAVERSGTSAEVDRVTWQGSFLNDTGYSTDLDPVVIISATMTNAPLELSFELEGALPPKPLITATMESLTSAAGLEISNVLTQETISVTSALEEDDVVSIGGLGTTINKNGSPINADGVIPRFKAGGNALNLSLNSSTKFTADNQFNSKLSGSGDTFTRGQQILAAGSGNLESVSIRVYSPFSFMGNGTYMAITSSSAGFPTARFTPNQPQLIIGSVLWSRPISVPRASSASIITVNPNIPVVSGTYYWIIIYSGEPTGGFRPIGWYYNDPSGLAGVSSAVHNTSSWSSNATGDYWHRYSIDPLTTYTVPVSITYDRLYP